MLENAVAGVVITLSQPIRINDTVIIDGRYGTVERIHLLFTVVKIWNWRRFVIPNHKLLQKEFENLTVIDGSEWAYVEFHVSPRSDLELVKKLAKSSMKCRYLSGREAPSFWVMDLGQQSIKCWVAGWAESPAEAWALKSHSRKKLAQLFIQNHVDFHLVSNRVDLISQPKPTEQAQPG
jgi:small-conductance mechanosensitive channel